MAKYNVYSVRDQLNGFGALLPDHNDSTAIRSFRFGLSNSKVSCIEDYDLFRVGSFETDTGVFVPEACPVLIYRGVDVK